MTEHMSDNDLNRLEALANAATPGPWEAENDCGTGILSGMLGGRPRMMPFGDVWTFADAVFIAAARTAVPELIAEVRRLRERLERCKPYMDHWHDCRPRFGSQCPCGFDDAMSEMGASDE